MVLKHHDLLYWDKIHPTFRKSKICVVWYWFINTYEPHHEKTRFWHCEKKNKKKTETLISCALIAQLISDIVFATQRKISSF